VEAKFLFRSFFVIRVSKFREGDVLVVNTLENNEPNSESDVVKSHHQVIDRLITRPSILKVSNVFRSSVNNGFVEAPEYIVIETESVGSSMPEKSSSQVLETRHGVVGESRSLVTFLTHESETDVSRLNHVNIVSTITNSSSDFRLGMFSHEVDYIGFLEGRRSINDSRFTAKEKCSDLFVEEFVLLVQNDGDSNTRNFNLVFFVLQFVYVHLFDNFEKISRFRLILRNIKNFTLLLVTLRSNDVSLSR
jgi:hypothetical protein